MSSFILFAGYSAILYVVLSLIYRLTRGLWIFKLGHMLGFGERFQPKDDSWAVITGATDGIGLAYANEFIRKGYNLLIIARSQDKLDAVKQELENCNKFKKQILLHKSDFSKLDIYEGIEKALSKLPRIDVLINNVGVSYDRPEYFASEEVKQTNSNIIFVNTISCIRMCYAVIPRMESQKRGVIMNISSFSALDPVPLLSVYGASKAFVDHFTRSIAYEYASKGITIQSVLPGFVITKMSKIRKPTLMAPTTKDYVKSQLKTVGLDGQTTGFWSHELQFYITQNVFPIIYGRSLSGNIAFNQMKLMRHKALKKLQNQADLKRD